MRLLFRLIFGGILCVGLLGSPARSVELEQRLGRNEVRIRSAAVPIPLGRTALESSLPHRLEQLGYRRVHDRPDRPGEYFFGRDVFWIHRRGFRWQGNDLPPRLLQIEVASSGRLTAVRAADGRPLGSDEARLEPLTIGESLDPDRALRIPIVLDDLPEHAWKAVLAAEDARFFRHHGIDGKAVARALLRNLKAGKVTEGGSTITQQLVKNRDLSPRRTLGRKVSEAMRTLWLESEHTKEEILESYLSSVYLGHVDGLAIHGIETAARTYFSTSAAELDLARAATLAAMIQGPNRLDPVSHPERVKERRDWVLGRMEELGWATREEVSGARRVPVRVHVTPAPHYPAPHFTAWVAATARREEPSRIDEGRGLVIDTTLDPLLQEAAERAVSDGLRRLRADHPAARTHELQAALVALDATTGEVLAYVGSDPDRADQFDRARSARRQPGSTIKPLLLLEAFQTCGSQSPLHPATRVLDAPLQIALPTGSWSPQNAGRRFRGTVTITEALQLSLNVPFVRIARHCGYDEVADRVRSAGLELPRPAPPSFALGSVETSPLNLAQAYTVFATPGEALVPRPILRLEKPGGRRLHRFRLDARRVAGADTSYVVRHLLEGAVLEGTARGAAIDSRPVAAKTGTSSGGRDAWVAGLLEPLVVVVWVGRDDDSPMGLSGGRSAAPIWRAFVEEATLALSPRPTVRPASVATHLIDLRTGRRARGSGEETTRMLFRRRVVPPKTGLFFSTSPLPPLE